MGGAKGIRTPDLLVANSARPGHVRPSRRSCQPLDGHPRPCWPDWLLYFAAVPGDSRTPNPLIPVGWLSSSLGVPASWVLTWAPASLGMQIRRCEFASFTHEWGDLRCDPETSCRGQPSGAPHDDRAAGCRSKEAGHTDLECSGRPAQRQRGSGLSLWEIRALPQILLKRQSLLEVTRICRNDESTLRTFESVVSSRFGALRILEIS